MSYRRWLTLILGLLMLPLWSSAATLKEEVESLRQELYKTRAELIQAINETRLAYQEDSKERRELRDRSNHELEAYQATISQFQERLKASEARIARLEQQNAKLEELINRHFQELQKLVIQESQLRGSADKQIVAELSKALEQGLTTIQVEQQQVTPTPPPAAAAPANLTTYTVVSGDTLSGLAKAVGISVERLKQLNNLQSDTIRVGQELKIPVP